MVNPPPREVWGLNVFQTLVEALGHAQALLALDAPRCTYSRWLSGKLRGPRRAVHCLYWLSPYSQSQIDSDCYTFVQILAVEARALRHENEALRNALKKLQSNKRLPPSAANDSRFHEFRGYGRDSVNMDAPDLGILGQLGSSNVDGARFRGTLVPSL